MGLLFFFSYKAYTFIILVYQFLFFYFYLFAYFYGKVVNKKKHGIIFKTENYPMVQLWYNFWSLRINLSFIYIETIEHPLINSSVYDMVWPHRGRYICKII